MTLAALTPLVTWWPLFFGLLVLIAKVVCPRIVRRQQGPIPSVWSIEVTAFGDLERTFITVGWPPPDPWGPPSPSMRFG